MPIISEGSYKPAFEDSKQVYAFERQYEDQKLLVLNNFYATEVEIDLSVAYQNGRFWFQTMKMQKCLKKFYSNRIKTLAIYVN